MFKKAKRKIVLSILAILGAVLIGTLGMICLASYVSVSAQDYQILKEHAEQLFNDQKPVQNTRGHEKIQRHLELNTFYTVRLSSDGSAQVVENGAENVYTEEELISLAEEAALKDRGKTGELLYIVTQEQGDTIVCFMDSTVFTDSFSQIFFFTLLFGLIAMAAITFISMAIAKRIVSPMEETYQKQKQFTADAGHELKTPIAAMAANIELLSRQIGENEWLDNIRYENDRMQALVTELLELARNENKTAEKKPEDLSRIVNGVILPMEAAAFEKNILLESQIQEGVTVNVDKNGITQLVTILVDNAVSHTEDAAGEGKEPGNGNKAGDFPADPAEAQSSREGIRRVRILLKEEKGTTCLQVSNPGEPIPEEERDKLFERFYRADSSHEFTGHYGLGLAIAKTIADANHVKLRVSCRDGYVTFTADFSAK